MKLQLLLAGILLPILTFCQISVKQYFVAESTIQCGTDKKKECLQIRESESDPWRILRENINGFNYKKGNRYVIEVQTYIERNPMDGSTKLKYTLNRIISKYKYKVKKEKPKKIDEEKKNNNTTDPKEIAATTENVQLMGKKWIVSKIFNGTKFVPNKDQNVYIEFDNINNRVNGNSGCNGFFGAATYSGNSFKAPQLGSTRMFCPDKMEMEVLFLKNLQEADTIVAEKNTIKLQKGNAILIVLE